MHCVFHLLCCYNYSFVAAAAIAKFSKLFVALILLGSVLEYMDETLFERKYGKIANLVRLSIQVYVVRALIHFKWKMIKNKLKADKDKKKIG